MEAISIEVPTISFDYEGESISFFKGKFVMVNATQMAKRFCKRPVDWLKTQAAKDFIATYSEVKNITSADLVQVTRGGDPSLQGTWMHQDIALEFARWLEPKLAIWCNDCIKELLTKGKVTLPDFNDPVAAARAWADEKEKSLKLEAENAERQKKK